MIELRHTVKIIPNPEFLIETLRITGADERFINVVLASVVQYGAKLFVDDTLPWTNDEDWRNYSHDHIDRQLGNEIVVSIDVERSEERIPWPIGRKDGEFDD